MMNNEVTSVPRSATGHLVTCYALLTVDEADCSCAPGYVWEDSLADWEMELMDCGA